MCPEALLRAKISFHLNFSRGKGRKRRLTLPSLTRTPALLGGRAAPRGRMLGGGVSTRRDDHRQQEHWLCKIRGNWIESLAAGWFQSERSQVPCASLQLGKPQCNCEKNPEVSPASH